MAACETVEERVHMYKKHISNHFETVRKKVNLIHMYMYMCGIVCIVIVYNRDACGLNHPHLPRLHAYC